MKYLQFLNHFIVIKDGLVIHQICLNIFTRFRFWRILSSKRSKCICKFSSVKKQKLDLLKAVKNINNKILNHQIDKVLKNINKK